MTQTTNKLKVVQDNYRNASVVVPETASDSRTVEVTFGTEALVARYDWRTDTMFWEELGFRDGEADISRLQGAAPVLDNHNTYEGARGTLGVVESATLDGTSGTAVMRFSKREDVEPIYQDVLDGIIRTVSVGYVVKKYTDTGRKGDNGWPVYRATNWEAREISLAPIAADPMSRIRSEKEPQMEVVFEGAAAPTPPAPTPEETTQRSAAPAGGKVPPADKPKTTRKMKDVNELKQLRAAKEDQLAAFDALERSGNLTDEQTAEMRALTSELEEIDNQITEIEKRKARLAARAAAGEGASKSEEVEIRSQSRVLNFGEAIAARAAGKNIDGVMAEWHQEAERQGFGSGDISIPTSFIEAIRAGSADDFQAGSGDGSGFVPTEVPSFIEGLTAPYLIETLGATTLTGLVGNQQFPRESVKASATAATEVAEGADSGMEMDQLDMSPKRYSASTKYSKQLMIQNSLNAGQLIANALRRGMERKLNSDFFTGASGGASITGIFNQTGVNDIAPADTTAYNDIVTAMMAAVLEDHGWNERCRWVMSPITWEKFSNAVETTAVSKLLSADGRIKTFAAEASPYLANASASLGRAAFADFSGAIMGYWGSLDLVVDTVTLKKEAQVEITLNQFVDLGLQQPYGFAVCDNIAVS